jgi:protein O-GlcNAc transferase
MPSPPATPAPVRYFLRRRGGAPGGPYDSAALLAQLAAGKLDGSEEISTDRAVWKSVRTLTPAPTKHAALPTTAAPRGVDIDLGNDGGISLAPLEIEQSGAARPGSESVAPKPPAPDTSSTQSTSQDDVLDIGPPGVDLGAALELEERRLPPVNTAANDASATVAAILEGETEPVTEATQPVRLDETAPPVHPRTRPRTMTAARGGQLAAAAKRGWRPSRRQAVVACTIVVVAGAALAVVKLDLIDRLRGEPTATAVLGPLAAGIASDQVPAFSDGARRLEESAEGRRRAPTIRAEAAALLAASVVIHGGERGRVTHAEALLEPDATATGKTVIVARARAAAWVALAKGRWKDAERIAAESDLGDGNRAAITGWAALGRDKANRAAELFATAAGATPAPFPSRAATLYALARAREGELSPDTEAAYRSVLAETPAHFGAALGLARLSKLSAAGRLKLVETAVAKQARDASRTELAEAYVLIARAARELSDNIRAEAALKRAREVDPASVAAAVAAGDVLLAEGHTDEAVPRYRLALAAPVSVPRTPWLKFAQIAALLDTARTTEATAALAELDRRLPGDARVPFWRGWAAERSRPADPIAAEQSYREATTRDPRFLPANLQLARLLVDRHRGADALTVLRHAETAGASATSLRIALGQTLLASGNASEAARMFRQVLASDAKDAAARLGLVGALEAQGSYESARAELTILQSQGNVAGLGPRVAAILIKLGRRDEALATYQKEIAAGGATAVTKVAAARLAIALGHKAVARAFATAAVDDDPRTPGALLALAEVWRLEGDLPRAVLELKRALAVDGQPEVQLEYGRALGALGRDEEALAALAQAREIPESAVERGRILLRRGDFETAVKELTAATTTLPASADAHLLLGQAEDRLGHAARAEAAWKTAVRLMPTMVETRYRLGRLLMDRSQAQSALQHLRAATERVATVVPAPSWLGDLYFQLGFAEFRQGSRDRALAAFRRYLEIAPADAPARAEVTRQIHEIAP